MGFWTASLVAAVFLRCVWVDWRTAVVWAVLVGLYTAANQLLACWYPNSFRRKFVIASWTAPREPVLHLREELDVDAVEGFLAEFNAAHPDEKITLTAVVARALGQAMGASGKTCGKIAFGHFVPVESVDISVAVDVRGENLANLVLRGCNQNGIRDLARQMRAAVRPLKEDRDPDFRRRVDTFRYFPSFLFDALLRLTTFLNYDLGIPMPFLKLSRDGFGTAVLTNVSGWMVRDTFAPLVPPLRCIACMLMNRPVERAVVRNGRVEVRRIMYLNTTFDHRFADGSDADKMVRALHAVLEAPHQYL